jgi:hypothetical protein
LLDDMTRQVVEAFTRWQSLADQLNTVKARSPPRRKVCAWPSKGS